MRTKNATKTSISHVLWSDSSPPTPPNPTSDTKQNDILNSGIEVSAFTCSDYCAQLSCSECTLDPACGWCEGSSGGCLSLTQQATCDGTFAESGCCAECALHETCQDCINSEGCGWSFSGGKCLSGNSNYGLCEAAEWFQVYNPAISTCRSVPGPVLAENSNVPVPTVQNTAVLDWCSSHGTHSFGTDYECVCHPGFYGEDCAHECPGGASNPCNGHGTCDKLTGACLCACGFGGEAGDCSLPLDCHCQGSNEFGTACYLSEGTECTADVCGVITSSTNTCSGTSLDFVPSDFSTAARSVNGSDCVCASGFWGPSCTSPCPGVDPVTGEGEICGGQGRCDVTTGQCECAPCYEDDGMGNCVPKSCPACKNGACECDIETGDMVCRCAGNWKGELCKGCKCQNGGSCSAYTGACECPIGFYGELCEFQCTRESLCHGNGNCNIEDRKCDCDAFYIGSTENQCRFYCPPEKCGANGFCSPSTGNCVCAKGYIGEPCTPACEAGVCKNGATCSYDDTTTLGYTCDCSTAPVRRISIFFPFPNSLYELVHLHKAFSHTYTHKLSSPSRATMAHIAAGTRTNASCPALASRFASTSLAPTLAAVCLGLS